jgi:hypothetical protein
LLLLLLLVATAICQQLQKQLGAAGKLTATTVQFLLLLLQMFVARREGLETFTNPRIRIPSVLTYLY